MGAGVIETSRIDELKRAAAIGALEHVRDGMRLGLGSGSTAEIFVHELGARVRQGLRVVGVATSNRVSMLATAQGVPLTSLDAVDRLDLTVDGADEVDIRTLALTKGRGGALLREKLVALASDRELIIVDDSKLVDRLGQRCAVPVAVIPFGWQQTAARLRALGCEPRLRMTHTGPFISDDGLVTLDCQFAPIEDPIGMAAALKAIPGVVEHGLFVDIADEVVVASAEGLRSLRRTRP
jgi:ribose 5-phosphate isomerase A